MNISHNILFDFGDIFKVRARVFANESAYRTIVFLIRTHLMPPFVFHPIRRDCIINRVKSKCLTSIGSGESPLEGRKMKERTREAVGCERKNQVNGAKGCNVEEGESSCEFYANLIAG